MTAGPGASGQDAHERRVGRAGSALDDAATRRPSDDGTTDSSETPASQEEERGLTAGPGASGQETAHATRQAIMYCPYCSEETLFPLEGGAWECRSCFRAFSIAFLGLRTRPGLSVKETP